MSGRRTLAALGVALLVVTPVHAQRAEPARWQAAGDYGTTAFEAQLTAAGVFDARATTVALGRLWAREPDGRWLPQAELGAGLLSGNRFLDGLTAVPQLRITRVFGASALLGSGAEHVTAPTLAAGAALHGLWFFAGPEEQRGTRLVPALRAAAGFHRMRLPQRDWIGFEVVLERRLDPGETVLYLRVSGARR